MKKLLLSLLVFGVTSASAQVLVTENFESQTVGNLTTLFDGSAPTPEGYFLYSENGTAPTTTTNAGLANAQIVDVAGTNLKTLKLTGPNGDKGASFVWKDGFPALWSGRTAGYDILTVTFKLYTGATTSSKNRFGISIYNSDFTKVLVGASFNASTKVLGMTAYSTPGTNPVGNYTYNLLASPGLVLASDSWVEITMTFNKTTGRATISAPGLSGNVYVDGSATGSDPAEVDFTAVSGTTTSGGANTAEFAVNFDDLTVAAINEALSASTVAIQESLVSVYPNPATDVLNINSGDLELVAVSVLDLNGRVILSQNADSTLNISTLAPGAYLISIKLQTVLLQKSLLKNNIFK